MDHVTNGPGSREEPETITSNQLKMTVKLWTSPRAAPSQLYPWHGRRSITEQGGTWR